jgi:hypothetical protein
LRRYGAEYRRLFPLLSERAETWAVDLLGWGFTDAGDAGIGGDSVQAESSLPIAPESAWFAATLAPLM